MKDEFFDIKKLKFSFNLADTDYQLDVLQNRILEFYLRADRRFRRAFSMNYTQDFLQYLRDKVRLREPVSLAMMGNVRTFTNNNFIFTEKGWRKPSNLKDCQYILSWNFDLEKYEWKKYELIIRKRDLKEKFYKITFSDNRIIELGENHPIFTLNKGWKKAYSLYPKIKMPYFFEYPQQEYKNEISIEKARIIACLLSCGHLNNSSFNSLDKRDGKIYKKVSHSISYASSNNEMINFFRDNFEKEFKIKPKLIKRKENYNGIVVELSNVKIFEELNKFVPSGKKSHIIEIPIEIFNASKNIQKEFIATLFSGDGYISDCKKGMAIAEYYTMSDKFAEQLQLILLQYGIISYINKKKTKTKSIINRIVITNKQNLLNFSNFVQILPHPQKDLRLKEIVNSFISPRKHLIPLEFYIKNKEEFEYKEDLVYDIYVQDNNNFFLNGILTHNSGKSYSALSVCVIHQAFLNRKFGVEYICANAMEFLEKLKSFPENKLKDRIFLIDEEKLTIFNLGSSAKKIKIQDVQNIVAIQNISTIMINPRSWANKEANYGLRVFGRCFNTKSCRLMLYNLQEHGAGGELPISCVYLPIFTSLLPKDYADELEIAYLKKKNEWVKQEMRGEGDVLAELRKKSAENFIRDKNFLQIRKKKEKLAFISQKLGSEWTSKECDDILTLTSLLEQGVLG